MYVFSYSLELKRVILLAHLNGVTKNLSSGSTEMVIHVDQ
jgi:hypothetical protein